jgi:hypothetical protein
LLGRSFGAENVKKSSKLWRLYCDVAFVFVIADSYKIEAIRSNEMSTESLI